jgi:hypothetical protein
MKLLQKIHKLPSRPLQVMISFIPTSCGRKLRTRDFGERVEVEAINDNSDTIKQSTWRNKHQKA